MLYAVIVGCEIAFWAFLLGGLFARYVLGLRRLSTLLLLLSPSADLLLLVVATVDLRRGGTATFAHALAAIYVGYSVAYGRHHVAAADRWVRRVTGRGPPPAPPAPAAAPPAPPGSPDWAHARRERLGWYRHLLMWAVGESLLGAGIVLVGDWQRTARLITVAAGWTVVLAVDFLISFSYTLFPRRVRAPGTRRAGPLGGIFGRHQ